MAEDEDQQQADLAAMLQQFEGDSGDSPSSPAAPPPLTSREQLSPVLCMLGDTLPDPMPVCGVCPKAMWLDGNEGLRCFSKVMHVTVWEAGDPQPITACDGPLIEEG